MDKIADSKTILINDDFKNESSIQKKSAHNYQLGILYLCAAQVFITLQTLQIKFFASYIEDYSALMLYLGRSIVLCFICYYIYEDKRKTEILNMDRASIYYLLARSACMISGLLSFSAALSLLRLSTVQSIVSLFPIVLTFLAVFLLKEKYYSRYTYGLISGVIGSLIIINSEKAEAEIGSHPIVSTFLGIFLSFFNIFTFVGVLIINKILIQIHFFHLQFSIGITGIPLSLLGLLLTGKIGLIFNLKTFLLYCSNGFIFWFIFYFYHKGFELVDAIISGPIQYLALVLLFICGVTIFKENLYFADILGILLIVGFNFYNAIKPIQSK